MFGPTDLTNPAYQRKFAEKGCLLFDVINPGLELLAWASLVAYVSADEPPFLIIYGDQDKGVNPRRSELLYERLLSFGVHAELVIFQNANHNFVPMGDVMNPTREEITQRMLAFFTQVFMPIP